MAWTDLDDFLGRVASRLDPPSGEARLPETGDRDFLTTQELAGIRPAAVLFGVIPRPSGATALLTLRPETMADHAGQVAFPGGKIDGRDADAVAAALREAHEEVGACPKDVDVRGLAAPYVTGTRYRITPVIGLLPADFRPVPEPGEVAAVFEAPLELLMDRASFVPRVVQYRGADRRYYELSYDGFRIWGVTAGIIRRLSETLYGPDH